MDISEFRNKRYIVKILINIQNNVKIVTPLIVKLRLFLRYFKISILASNVLFSFQLGNYCWKETYDILLHYLISTLNDTLCSKQKPHSTYLRYKRS